MIMALLWLTVSLPYVYKAQQIQKQISKEKSTDDNNPLSNTVEEKNESGVNTLNEYLHETTVLQQPVLILPSGFKCNPTDLYFAYHPELLSPPPEGFVIYYL